MKKKIVHKDVVIIGAGMAGLTAALYCGRMNLDTLVLESGIIGGQIANAVSIENYPGFESISGGELIATLQKQAENFGAVIDEFDVIEKVTLKSTPKIVETEEHIYQCDAVIIASGMERRKLP
ncbi:MAG: FAD-dependent oxidoreductase, partial [Selenomonadaceae bacterium]|nr:FAD-dependent oxidoreductase [Selenomonadaceae bacterium]